MPVVKIVAKGFETYNGIIEGVQFENGVSMESMSQASAERVGAFMKIENADPGQEGKPLGMGYRIADARTSGTAPREPLQWIKRTPTGKKKESVKKAKEVFYDFTKADLEAAADKGGITELRQIADQYEVRGRSIADIVDNLMALKANQEAKTAAATPRANVEAKVEAKVEADEMAEVFGVNDIDSLIED